MFIGTISETTYDPSWGRTNPLAFCYKHLNPLGLPCCKLLPVRPTKAVRRVYPDCRTQDNPSDRSKRSDGLLMVLPMMPEAPNVYRDD
jgi:hypothetical protein